jgi:hypothetical protein
MPSASHSGSADCPPRCASRNKAGLLRRPPSDLFNYHFDDRARLIEDPPNFLGLSNRRANATGAR